VTADRETLENHKVPYARKEPTDKKLTSLKDVVAEIKPNMLIGLSGQGGAFDKEVIDELQKHTSHPIIFALSNPTSQAECTAEQAYSWTNGTVIFASGSPFDPVEIDGKTYVPGQGNNMFIFPVYR
jgi:malate dehydrogenase (oxaloacetate-decarboxylating)(NADP+)